MTSPRVFLGLPECRVVLCLTPKVGSQSIITAMMEFYGIEAGGKLHLNPAFSFMSRADVERHLGGWRRAVFVRNPFDRLAANYHYHIHLTRLSRCRNMRDIGYTTEMSFDAFVRKACREPSADPHTALQTVLAGNCEFVGRIETAADDWGRFKEFTGLALPALPMINRNASRPPYREDYTSDLKDLVEKAYRRDLAAFGYAF